MSVYAGKYKIEEFHRMSAAVPVYDYMYHAAEVLLKLGRISVPIGPELEIGPEQC